MIKKNKLKWLKSVLAGHSDSQRDFCSCAIPISSHICILSVQRNQCSSAPHNQRGRTKRDQKKSSQHVKGRHHAQFERESSHTADAAWTHPWSYCLCSIPRCIHLVWSCQLLGISSCLWAGNGLQYQFTCCASCAGAVNSCLKHSVKLVSPSMVAQVHGSHWLEGNHFTSCNRVERMGTYDSLTKAILSPQSSWSPIDPVHLVLEQQSDGSKCLFK